MIVLLRTVSRVRKRPSKVRIGWTLACDAARGGRASRCSVFVGKHELPVSQLDYAIRCGNEARAKKTW